MWHTIGHYVTLKDRNGSYWIKEKVRHITFKYFYLTEFMTKNKFKKKFLTKIIIFVHFFKKLLLLCGANMHERRKKHFVMV